jgi:hypothetical protein
VGKKEGRIATPLTGITLGKKEGRIVTPLTGITPPHVLFLSQARN